MSKPIKPTLAQCGHGLEAGSESSQKPTPAGRYTYDTSGYKTVVGEKRQKSKLPGQTQIIVTAARKIGNIWCYKSQSRLGRSLGDTTTLLVRGSDVYLRSLRFQAGGYIKMLTPSQPPLSLSGTELNWSGTFRGATSGRYAAEIIGRRSIRVGSKKVKTVGVHSRISYAGDIRGWQRSTSWIDTKDSKLVDEKVVQERSFGLDRLRLSYRRRLESFRPS